MNKNAGSLVIFCVLFVFLCLPICGEEPKKSQLMGKSAEEIATDASGGVERVGEIVKTFSGSKGAPIIILEEIHASRAVQIEHAITLVRLHDLYGLKHIGLEGYLKEGPKIETDYFNDTAWNFTSKVGVAVRLLKEGEISEAEFMKLVYEDVSVYPIESIEQYPKPPDDLDYETPLLIVVKIALQTMSDEDLLKLLPLIEEYIQAEDENNLELAEEKRKELLDILSKDPWVKDRFNALMDIDTSKSSSIEQELSLARDIIERADQLSLELEPAEKDSMDRYIAFLKARSDASESMAKSIGGLADQPGASIVALVIGAGHTEKICTLLEDADRSYVVIRPHSINEIDIPLEMFERKHNMLSIYSEGFTETLREAIPPYEQIKPQPGSLIPVNQAKAEIYLLTNKIVHKLLGPSNPPNNGNPPYGFNENDLKRKWVSVDPTRIELVPDTPDGKGRAVLFPLILNPGDPNKRKEIWFKAGLGVTSATDVEDMENVEKMLRKALNEVKNEELLDERIEDEAGRIQITTDVVAALAGTRERAKEIILGTV